ncbi:MAG TPA: HAMP domain-containing sensor histidine kinase, partial [Chloroflexota bacterium]|nr:HAMP domain-containing sensor histidine kinase [Chloroflexota bacterium]
LSVAAHELKTPLASLMGHAQLALKRLEREGPLDADRVAGALGTIADQSKRLSRLLSHLLDVTRLETGRLTLEREPADLAALVRRSVETVQALTRRHTITLRAAERLDVWGDALRLEQVLTNLLDNAVKFSPGGGAIDVVLLELPGGADGPGGAGVAGGEPDAGARGPVAELSVRDHGLGVPAGQRDQLFERYFQAHADEHRSGMGLGLYVCREIVQLHGGEIISEFPPDGGTRFVVRLPAGDPAL